MNIHNQEKVYIISSGETDASHRYMMRFNALEAKMSKHLTSLVSLSNDVTDLGIMESVDSRSLLIIDRYIKHYAISEQNVTDKIESSSVMYHKIGHLPLEIRFQIDEYETQILKNSQNIFSNSSNGYTDLLTSVLYMGIDPLMNAIEKNLASKIFDLCWYYGDVENKIYDIDKNRVCYLKYLFIPITNDFSDDDMIEWKKTDIYKNFYDTLFQKHYVETDGKNIPDPLLHPSKTYRLLGDMLSLSQLNPSYPMYHLGTYFIGVMQLLLPCIIMYQDDQDDSDYLTSSYDNDCPYPYNYFQSELLFQLNDDILNQIKKIDASSCHTKAFSKNQKIPLEIYRLNNLKKIKGISNKYKSLFENLDGFQLVSRVEYEIKLVKIA